MADRDMIHERGRSLEDDYFRKKDKELVEKLQRAADAERAKTDMGKAAGITDPAALQELLDLGFTPQTVGLLPIEGGEADRQLTAWMTDRPSEAVFAHAGRLIRAMLDSGATGLNADDLVDFCERIASASGGVFGIGKISAEERTLLAGLVADLKGRQS
jgi:hypothetical protein